MRKVNLYKVYSRLGVQNLPWRGEEINYGVEEAPDYILTPDFISKFDNPQIKEFRFSFPEDVKKDDYFKMMADESLQLAKLIEETQKKRPVTAILIGGDHSVSFGSIIAQMRLYGPENVGVIHFDSHDDVCNISSSPTKNFHGMFLRALTDKEFDDESIRRIPDYLPPENILIIGNIDCNDDPEGKYLAEKNIKHFELKDININKQAFLEYVKGFMGKFKHIHISFDIDVFDKSIVEATGTPSDDGFLYGDLEEVLYLIYSVDSISIDLVEINPKKPNSANTLDIARKILNTILK